MMIPVVGFGYVEAQQQLLAVCWHFQLTESVL
jgi:hypothetical protein